MNASGQREELLHNIDPLTPVKGDILYPDTFPSNVRAAIRWKDWKLITGNPGMSFMCSQKAWFWLINVNQAKINII